MATLAVGVLRGPGGRWHGRYPNPLCCFSGNGQTEVGSPGRLLTMAASAARTETPQTPGEPPLAELGGRALAPQGTSCDCPSGLCALLPPALV